MIDRISFFFDFRVEVEGRIGKIFTDRTSYFFDFVRVRKRRQGDFHNGFRNVLRRPDLSAEIQIAR